MLKCVIIGDVGSGVVECDLSYTRYIVGILTNKANISI